MPRHNLQHIPEHDHADIVASIAKVTEAAIRVEEQVRATMMMHDRFITREFPEVQRKIEELQRDSKELFVTRAEFEAQFSPVRLLVYAIVGLTLTAVMTGLLGLIFQTVKVAE